MIGYILKIKMKQVLYILLIFVCLYFIIHELDLYNSLNSERYHFMGKEVLPTVIWWTPFLKTNDLRTIYCGNFKCVLTEDRNYINNSSAFLFYASSFIPYDLPLPRKNSHLWAILHEESPKNLALFLHEDSHALFNYTSTFSRYSNFPITLQHLPSLHLLTGTQYFLQTTEKNRILENLSPILYIQSDCETPLQRDSYVSELMKFVSVDSYGKCLNNKKLPESLTINPLENLYSDEFMNFVAQYKFVIAFENAICEDYITEKLWRPLIVGSVPIYMGSPSVQDWLPNNNSVILANNFENPKKLAEFILRLNSDDKMYEKYLQHKLLNRVDNKLLLETMSQRHWGTESEDEFHYFSAYECFVCENIHKNVKYGPGYKNIYNCPEPISPLTKKKNNSNWWLDHWHEGKCQTKALKKLISRNNFTKQEFDHETQRLSRENNC